MARRRIVANSLEYDFIPDTVPRVGTRWWALVTAQLMDEIRGEPITSRFTLRADTAGVAAKAGDSGTFCLVARPHVRFLPLSLPRTIRVHIEAQGYLPQSVDLPVPFDTRTFTALAVAATRTVTLNSTAGLLAGQAVVLGAALNQEFGRIDTLGPGPNQLGLAEPLAFGHPIGDACVAATPPAVRVSLRRAPVSIAGRVMRIGAAGAPATPIVGATVSMADFWITQRDVQTRPYAGNVPVGEMTKAAPNTFMVALGQGMLASRPVNATAGPVDLPVAAGDEKTLLGAEARGATTLRLSNRVNVAPTTLLRIDSSAVDRSEIHSVNAVVGLGNPNDPARVTLNHPLLGSHPAGVRADRLAPPAVPLPLQLRNAALPGDRTLLLSAPPAPVRAGLLVRSAGMADEFHDAALYSVSSDVQGYFRLPPIHRVAQIRLDVDDGATSVPFYVDPEYGASEQWLDLKRS